MIVCFTCSTIASRKYCYAHVATTFRQKSYKAGNGSKRRCTLEANNMGKTTIFSTDLLRMFVCFTFSVIALPWTQVLCLAFLPIPNNNLSLPRIPKAYQI
eukprot:scaffold22713_cov139-Cylindrotheca_fusiformis.AAC.19